MYICIEASTSTLDSTLLDNPNPNIYIYLYKSQPPCHGGGCFLSIFRCFRSMITFTSLEVNVCKSLYQA